MPPTAHDRPARILLVAGGTGGHVYPALALGEELRRRDPSIEIAYCCGSRPGELAIYAGRGIEPWKLPLTGRRSGAKETLKFVREFAASMFVARRLAKRFRPTLAVGFGNYLSAPGLLAARAAGARLALHEQNAHPGAANRWLARLCDKVLLGAPVPPGAFPEGKTRLVGNPVRADLLDPLDPAEARRSFGLPEDGRVLLCFGGSLGAARVNDAIEKALPAILSAGWNVLWATGPPHRDAIAARLAASGLLSAPPVGQVLDPTTNPRPAPPSPNPPPAIPPSPARVQVLPYLDRMREAYAAADLVVCRAGALTLAELTALGKPAILIPLPTSAGDHQRANARALQNAGAAIVVEEGSPGASDELAKAVQDLGRTPDRLTSMSQAARRLGRPQAAREMADALAPL